MKLGWCQFCLLSVPLSSFHPLSWSHSVLHPVREIIDINSRSQQFKALFNNFFTFKKSELHGPTCYQCLWEGVKMKPWKKLYFKSIIKCFKRVKIDKWPDSPYSFFPIDDCVRMVSQTFYSVVIFSHRFLDSDCINFKTFALLAVYWPFRTSSYNTNIKAQQFFWTWSSTMLNNVYNL